MASVRYSLYNDAFIIGQVVSDPNTGGGILTRLHFLSTDFTLRNDTFSFNSGAGIPIAYEDPNSFELLPTGRPSDSYYFLSGVKTADIYQICERGDRSFAKKVKSMDYASEALQNWLTPPDVATVSAKLLVAFPSTAYIFKYQSGSGTMGYDLALFDTSNFAYPLFGFLNSQSSGLSQPSIATVFTPDLLMLSGQSYYYDANTPLMLISRQNLQTFKEYSFNTLGTTEVPDMKMIVQAAARQDRSYFVQAQRIFAVDLVSDPAQPTTVGGLDIVSYGTLQFTSMKEVAGTELLILLYSTGYAGGGGGPLSLKRMLSQELAETTTIDSTFGGFAIVSRSDIETGAIISLASSFIDEGHKLWSSTSVYRTSLECCRFTPERIYFSVSMMAPYPNVETVIAPPPPPPLDVYRRRMQLTSGEEVSQPTAGLSGSHAQIRLYSIPVTATTFKPCPASQPFLQDGLCVAACDPALYLQEQYSLCVGSCPYFVNGQKICYNGLGVKILRAGILRPNRVVMKMAVSMLGQKGEMIPVTKWDSRLGTPDTIISRGCVGSIKEPDEVCGSPVAGSGSLAEDGTLEVTFQMETNHLDYSYESASVIPNKMMAFYGDNVRSQPSDKEVFLQEPIKAEPAGSGGDALLTIANTVAATSQLLRVFAPLAFVIGGAGVGGIFHIFANAYTKLTLISRFSFYLPGSLVARLYFELFEEIIPRFFKVIRVWAYGKEALQTNLKMTCEAGYNKYCQLGVEDNFWIAQFFTFSFLFSNFLVLLFVLLALYLIKKEKWRLRLWNYQKRVLFWAFYANREMDLHFSLILTLVVQIYKLPVLTFTKVCGLITLAVTALLVLLLLRGKRIAKDDEFVVDDSDKKPEDILDEKGEQEVYKGFLVTRLGCYMVTRLQHIFVKTINEEYIDRYTKAFVVHGIIFAMVNVFFAKVPILQIVTWIIAEAGMAVIFFMKPIYKTKMLNLRQRITSVALVVLCIGTLIAELTNAKSGVEFPVFIASVVILVTDLTFCIWEATRLSFQGLKAMFQKIKGVDSSVAPTKSATEIGASGDQSEFVLGQKGLTSNRTSMPLHSLENNLADKSEVIDSSVITPASPTKIPSKNRPPVIKSKK